VRLIARPHYLKWLRAFAREHFQQKIFSAQNDAFLVDTDFLSAAVGNLEVHVYKMAPGTSPRDSDGPQGESAAETRTGNTEEVAAVRAEASSRFRTPSGPRPQ